MNRYLVVTLIAVVAVFLSRAQKFKTFGPDVVTEERLSRILESTDQKVLLYFWQPDSPPCEATTPLLEQLAKDYPKIRVVKINTALADNRAVHDQYNVQATPTLIVVEKGKVVGFPWVGPFADKNKLLMFVRPSSKY
ncbi:MAG: thioredoxin family protein [Nibricoccus sp.]